MLRSLLFRCFFTFIGISSAIAQTSGQNVLWNIGVADSSSSEFALAPDGFESFVPEGFGGDHRYYVVGESSPKKDFPYVLPGPKDGFGGYGYWSGLALNTLPIYFELDKLPQTGNCTLTIDILAVNAEQPPLFRCSVNGTNFDHQLKGGISKLPQNMQGGNEKLSIDLPVSILKQGINKIEFQNMTGQWCVFDAIVLHGPATVQMKNPGKTLIYSVGFADHEIKGDVLPLQVGLRHSGKKAKIKAVVDGNTKELTMEEGHSVLEFLFPTVGREKQEPVQIFVNGMLKYEAVLPRRPVPKVQLVDYVDQFMGTSGSRWMIAPGPWMPMGMVKISPDNEESQWKAGYEYQIENVMGFSHIHEWTMAGLLMMPTNGTLRIQPGPANNPDLGYRSRIDKKKELAEVGKYRTVLTDYGIEVELTATTRASMQRYTFPPDRKNRVLIDLHFPAEYIWELRDAEITRVSDTQIEGWAYSYSAGTGYVGEQEYKLHFVIEFDRPMESMGGWVIDRIIEKTDKINRASYEPNWQFRAGEMKITDAGAFVNFPKGTSEVNIRTGISLVNIDQARLNLQEELIKPFGWDFEAVVANQKKVWNNLLSRVEVETEDYLQKKKFYTNMYRALSPRNTWSDVNGKWIDMDEKVQRTSPSKPMYGSDGYWGWQWNLVQFYNLIAPEISSNWINTYLEMYDKGGWLPIGNPGMEYFRVMVGQPEIPLIVSAYQQGIRDFDVDKMFEALYHQQTALMQDYPGGGQVGNESYNYYLDRGYVPLNKDYQSYVSNTMEYAYQDWCFAQYAKAMGKEDVYSEFMDRSENWRNIFDPTTGFVRPRNLDGSWYKDFSPFRSPGFCESNSWQYTWYVPQNMSGLVELMGQENFIKKLDDAMELSEKVYFNALSDNFAAYPINHGNQSNMQSCYLFNHAGVPWLTQKWARAMQEKYYGLGPRNAYPGDEDQGQMSSWFVMSALGLFQMDGGASVEPQYELGSPRLKKVTLHLSDSYYDGKTFVIEAKNASRENKYIQSAMLNGKKLKTWHFLQSELIKGGKLILEMGKNPNKNVFTKD